MSILQGIALGVLQGFTEFLPISSSGHLVLARHLFGIDEIPVLFDVILHVATLIAVVFVLWNRVRYFFCAIIRWIRRKTLPCDTIYLRLIPIILITTVITGVIGISLDAMLMIRRATLVSALFLVTAGLLIASRWFRGERGLDRIGWLDALILGIAQGFSILPGISRSGTTISVALYRGIERKTAGEYSFLLSIPAILGALILTVRDLGELGASVGIIPVVAGALSACIVGSASLIGLLRIVRSGRLYLFAFYLLPMGIGGLVYFSR